MAGKKQAPVAPEVDEEWGPVVEPGVEPETKPKTAALLPQSVAPPAAPAKPERGQRWPVGKWGYRK